MLSAIIFLLGVIVGILACVVGILALNRNARIEGDEIIFEPLVPLQKQRGDIVEVNKTAQFLKENEGAEIHLGDIIEND